MAVHHPHLSSARAPPCHSLQDGSWDTHVWCPIFVFLFLSGAPVSVMTAQGTPLEHLALVAGEGLHAWSHQTVTVREAVHGRLPPPERCGDHRPRHTHTQSVCERGLRACRVPPEGQASGCHTGHVLWGARALSLLPSVARQCLPEKSLDTHPEAWSLQPLCRGHLQIAWSDGQKDSPLRSHRTVYICIL